MTDTVGGSASSEKDMLLKDMHDDGHDQRQIDRHVGGLC
jgi:hypothetical protein